MNCAVEDCTNLKSKSKSRYFSFPKDPQLQKRWAHFCRRPDTINSKSEKICIEHFLESDFERDLGYELGVYSKPRLKLKPGTVPSQSNDMDIEFLDCCVLQAVVGEEAQQAKRKQIVDALLSEYDEKQTEESVQAGNSFEGSVGEEDDIEELPPEEMIQVVVDAEAYLTSLERENTQLRRLNFKLKHAAQRKPKTKEEKLQFQLDQANARYQQLFGQMEKVFSKAQICKLQRGKPVAWPKQDLRDASDLCAISPAAYNMLLQKRYPLPSIRALQHWKASERGKLP
ncbi:hypothetical protein ACLKA6_013019 [Drosophila palustris]